MFIQVREKCDFCMYNNLQHYSHTNITRKAPPLPPSPISGKSRTFFKSLRVTMDTKRSEESRIKSFPTLLRFKTSKASEKAKGSLAVTTFSVMTLQRYLVHHLKWCWESEIWKENGPAKVRPLPQKKSAQKLSSIQSTHWEAKLLLSIFTQIRISACDNTQQPTTQLSIMCNGYWGHTFGILQLIQIS